MNPFTKRIFLFAATLTTGAALCCPRVFADATAPAASTAASSSALPAVGKFGEIKIDADSCTFDATAFVYHNAHMVAQNGATLDADEIRANLDAAGKFENAVATGNMHAHFSNPAQKQVFTLTADKAVFTPTANQINLTGSVRVTVDSPATDGPAVQTGDSGVIYLGKAPDYPRLDMTNVHGTFTPAQ